jgi:hypothetical protein
MSSTSNGHMEHLARVSCNRIAAVQAVSWLAIPAAAGAVVGLPAEHVRGVGNIPRPTRLP